jgi:tryptophan-rich sensory protein
MTIKELLALVGFVAVCFAAAGMGSLATQPNLGWYAELNKPAWTPPAWLFGPVWTALYAAMGVAAWLVWRAAGGLRRAALPLGVFGLQLALNVVWSLIFFGMRLPGWAAVEIALLWVAIALTMAAFWPWSRWAVGLLAPYLAWVSFAAILNWSIWKLNV